jgi:NifU-like protein
VSQNRRRRQSQVMKKRTQELLRDHFINPRNWGEIPDPDYILETGSIAAGDALKLMIKLDDEGHIREARFQSFGAGGSIAFLSALTTLLIGKTVPEAVCISVKDLCEHLSSSSKNNHANACQALTLLKTGLRQQAGDSQKRPLFSNADPGAGAAKNQIG